MNWLLLDAHWFKISLVYGMNIGLGFMLALNVHKTSLNQFGIMVGPFSLVISWEDSEQEDDVSDYAMAKESE